MIFRLFKSPAEFTLKSWTLYNDFLQWKWNQWRVIKRSPLQLWEGRSRRRNWALVCGARLLLYTIGGGRGFAAVLRLKAAVCRALSSSSSSCVVESSQQRSSKQERLVHSTALAALPLESAHCAALRPGPQLAKRATTLSCGTPAAASYIRRLYTAQWSYNY